MKGEASRGRRAGGRARRAGEEGGRDDTQQQRGRGDKSGDDAGSPHGVASNIFPVSYNSLVHIT